MSLFPYAIGKLQGILQFLPGKDAGLVETFRQKSLADRTGMPLSHQRHIVAAAGGMGSGGASFGTLITIQQMIVRSEDDIRRISQELYNLMQVGSRAQGRIITA